MGSETIRKKEKQPDEDDDEIILPKNGNIRLSE